MVGARRSLKTVLLFGTSIAILMGVLMLMLVIVFSYRSIRESDLKTNFHHQSTSTTLSQFGSHETEYMCTGACYCENDDNNKNDNLLRRRNGQSVSAVTRGITTFLTAASTAIAYKLSKDYFDDRCAEEFECGENNVHILSEVDECSPTNEDSLKDTTTDADNNKKEEKSGKYGCTGFCIGVNIEDTRECSTIDHQAYIGMKKVDFWLGSGSKELSLMLTFLRDELDPFCKDENPKCEGVKMHDFKKPPEYDDRVSCRKLPWWHSANIGTYNAGGVSDGDSGGGDGGPPASSGGGGGCSAASCKGCSGC